MQQVLHARFMHFWLGLTGLRTTITCEILHSLFHLCLCPTSPAAQVRPIHPCWSRISLASLAPHSQCSLCFRDPGKKTAFEDVPDLRREIHVYCYCCSEPWKQGLLRTRHRPQVWVTPPVVSFHTRKLPRPSTFVLT